MVCIECGQEPLMGWNIPFTIVEGEQCCARHAVERLARISSQKIQALEVDNTDNKARITSLESKVP